MAENKIQTSRNAPDARREEEGVAPLRRRRPTKSAGHLWKFDGGESGIRTHVRFDPKHAFQACAFSHSATSP